MIRTELFRSTIGSVGVEDVVLPNGVSASLLILRHPGAAAVVPLHADGTVTLLRQHRHAAGGTILEIPAGKLDAGEDPAVCAARELAEEAGLRGTLRHLTTILPAPAFADEQIWLYLATDLEPVPMAHEADEVITLLRVPLAEAIRWAQTGEIRDAKTLVALWMVHAAVGRT